MKIYLGTYLIGYKGSPAATQYYQLVQAGDWHEAQEKLDNFTSKEIERWKQDKTLENVELRGCVVQETL